MADEDRSRRCRKGGFKAKGIVPAVHIAVGNLDVIAGIDIEAVVIARDMIINVHAVGTDAMGLRKMHHPHGGCLEPEISEGNAIAAHEPQ